MFYYIFSLESGWLVEIPEFFIQAVCSDLLCLLWFCRHTDHLALLHSRQAPWFQRNISAKSRAIHLIVFQQATVYFICHGGGFVNLYHQVIFHVRLESPKNMESTVSSTLRFVPETLEATEVPKNNLQIYLLPKSQVIFKYISSHRHLLFDGFRDFWITLNSQTAQLGQDRHLKQTWQVFQVNLDQSLPFTNRSS